MKIDPFPGVLTKQWVDRPFITKTGRLGCQHIYAFELTDEQLAWLRRWFPEEENRKLMKASGMTHSTLHRFARRFGLTKSDAGWRRIKKRQARRIKHVCEKNGHYERLRGKQPSAACRQGTARMWQDIRDGKREHPMMIVKRQNPRKYKKWLEHKSEARKELHRKEVLRLKWGLPRKTRLRTVVLCKYTPSQRNHRYNALRRGYIVFEDSSEQGGERYNIYYDADTRRAPKFEKNLIADGFKVKEYQQN